MKKPFFFLVSLSVIMAVIMPVVGYIYHLTWVIGYALMNLDTISVGEGIIMIGGTLVIPLGCIHGLVLMFS